jgi:hypothetical protein
MDPAELPPDLAHLERRLAERPRQEPPADLRQRVLAALGRGCGREATGFWRFVAAVAAAVVLAINLSMSAANDTDWRLGGDLAPKQTASADRIREVLPELSEREARRQAVLLRARSFLTLVPCQRTSPQRGVPRWGMR